MIVDGFKEKMDLIGEKSEMFIPYIDSADNLQEKIVKEKNFIVRHSRSTTKILPFKFSERIERTSLDKKNRKSV